MNTGVEGVELPLALVAITETEYIVALVRPVMVQVSVVATQLNDRPLAEAVAV